MNKPSDRFPEEDLSEDFIPENDYETEADFAEEEDYMTEAYEEDYGRETADDADNPPEFAQTAAAPVNQLELQKAGLEKKIANGRTTIALISVLTLINLVMYFSGSERSFVFSLFTPQFASLFAWESGIDVFMFFGNAIAVACLLFFFALYLLSKKNYRLMPVAFAFFLVDTALMLGVYYYFGISFVDVTIEILFHVWALWALYGPARAAGQLKKLSQEAVEL